MRSESRGESLFYERMKASLRETGARLFELRRLASEAVGSGSLEPEDDDSVLPISSNAEYINQSISKPATATAPASTTAAVSASHPTTSAATAKLWQFIQDDDGDEVGDDVLLALPSAQYSDANFAHRSRYCLLTTWNCELYSNGLYFLYCTCAYSFASDPTVVQFFNEFHQFCQRVGRIIDSNGKWSDFANNLLQIYFYHY